VRARSRTRTEQAAEVFGRIERERQALRGSQRVGEGALSYYREATMAELRRMDTLNERAYVALDVLGLAF
jgi:hypothetical protein